MESGAEHTLATYLAAARQQAGAPSLRAIAARTDYSHTTVGKAFGSNDPSLLQWAIVEQITTALGASSDTAQGLWASANEAAADPEPAAGGHPHGRMVITYGWCAVLLTGGIVIAMVQSVDRNVAHTTFVTDLAQLLFIAGTAVAFARHAVTARRRGDRLSLMFFLWLTAGALAWTAGQALWFTARNIDDQLIPSGHLHDVGYLLMPVCMGVALWMRAGRLGLMDVSRSAQRLFSVVCVLGGSYATTVMIISLLHLQIAGFELLAALYPATDLTLAFLAAIPLVFGRRIVGSIILSTAFLAAAASDMAYLLLKANPSTEMMAPQAALGYIGFTIMLSLYTTVSQPLPDRQTRRQKAATAARARVVIDTVTAISTIGAAICAAIVLWSGPTTEVGIAAFVAIVTVATACAVRMALNSANPAMSSRARTDSPSLA